MCILRGKHLAVFETVVPYYKVFWVKNAKNDIFLRKTGFGSVVVDFLFIVTPIVGVCNCSMFCCTLFYVHSSIAIILMGKRELVALLYLSSWCLVMVERLFLAVPQGCLRFVSVVFPDHTHLLFWCSFLMKSKCMWLQTALPGLKNTKQ